MMIDRQFRGHGARLIALGALALAACSSGDANEARERTAGAASQSKPAAGELPGCGAIAGAVGAPLTTMDLLPTDEPERWRQPTSHGVTCTWGTGAAIRVTRDETRNLAEIADIGTLTMSIVVSAQALDEADARSIGMALEDARAKEIGGWVMASAKMDRDKTLGLVAPQVVVGNTAVAFASAGVLLNRVPELESITNDWSIAASVAVHRLIEE